MYRETELPGEVDEMQGAISDQQSAVSRRRSAGQGGKDRRRNKWGTVPIRAPRLAWSRRKWDCPLRKCDSYCFADPNLPGALPNQVAKEQAHAASAPRGAGNIIPYMYLSICLRAKDWVVSHARPRRWSFRAWCGRGPDRGASGRQRRRKVRSAKELGILSQPRGGIVSDRNFRT